MVSAQTKNRVGYLILTIGVVIGLFAAYQNDAAIRKVNTKQTTFIIRQCDREQFRNKIAINFLERDHKRVEAEHFDPAVKAAYLSVINKQIMRLNHIPPCKLP